MDWPFMTYTKPQPCRLLELPPELRDVIFEYATRSEKPLTAFRLDNFQLHDYEEATQPPLTRTCRQIRNESLPVFYRSNDIVLHTDGSKYDETSAFLRCVAAHIPKMHILSLWVRYVTFTNMRSLASGAICIRLRRPKPIADLQVDDEWQWKTPTRPPPAVASDGKFLIRQLKAMLAEGRSYLETADSLAAALVDLRMEYVKEKMS